MHSELHMRVLLALVAVLFSLTAALSAALLVYAVRRSGLQAVSWGAGTFAGILGLSLTVLSFVLL